nr:MULTISPECIES: TolC family protein [unclassified Lysobacter]
MALAGKPISFPDAATRIEDHPQLEVREALHQGAQAMRDGARALRYPNIGVAATYARISDPIELDLGLLNLILHDLDPRLPKIPNPVLQPDTFGIAMATITWPIFTGGRISAANEASKAGIIVTEAARDETRDALLLDLVARYHGVGVAMQALAVEEGVVASLREHLRHANSLEANGQIAALDRMRVEVALAQAETSRQQRLHALEIAKAGLASLLSLEDDVDPVTQLGTPPRVEALSSYQSEALQTNPVLRQIAAAAEQAEQGVRAAHGEYWPTVALVGGYELESYHLPELVPEWTVGVTVAMPLFDGGARRSRLSMAKSKLLEAQALHRDGRNKIRLIIQQRYLDCEDAIRRVDVATRTVALARESLRMQRIAFAEGETRSIDVVDAENALATARLGRLAARYDHALAWATLMLASGHRDEVVRVFSQDYSEADSNAY